MDYKRVRISKLAHLRSSAVRQITWDELDPGLALQGIPVDYSITGILEEDIAVGKRAEVIRESRNGVITPGIFETSVVDEIIRGNSKIIHFVTENSVYKMEIL